MKTPVKYSVNIKFDVDNISINLKKYIFGWVVRTYPMHISIFW